MDTHAPADLVLQLQGLFPAGTGIACTTALPATATLYPAEEQATQGMVAARRQAYVQGRDCAHRALAQLGYPSAPVPVGEQRAPLWPAGIAGSIAHCAGRAIAVAARQEVAGGLGVDMELAGDLEPGVLNLVCTPAERDWLRHAGDPGLARILFVIKESVYKCLWPRVRRFVDFQEVEIELVPGPRRYRARALGADLDPVTVASIGGRYLQADELLFASAYLPPALTL